MDMRRFLIVGLVSCSLPWVGCTSKSATNQLQPSSGPALSKSSATAPFHDPRYQKLVNEVERKSDESPSTTQKIGSAVKKASSSVASALTLKPKVDKGDDPVSLDNMPDKIDVDVYYQAGRMADSSGNAEIAIKQYKRALQEDANHIPSLISMARLYDRQDNFQEAERLYRRAIKAEPENAMAYNDLGLCMARNDHAEESLAALRQAVKLEPKRKLYRNNLATVLVDMGRTEEALSELATAHPTAVAHYNLGYLLHEKGNQEEARRQFALAYEADKSLAMAQQMLAQLGGQAKSPAAPADKVRYRVDDALAETRGVASPSGPRVTPVAMVLSPTDLRRIPPTDSKTGDSSVKPPTVRLHEPVPLGSESQTEPSAAPTLMSPSDSGMHLPVPTKSGGVVPGDDDADLPTPQLLHEVAQHVN